MKFFLALPEDKVSTLYSDGTQAQDENLAYLIQSGMFQLIPFEMVDGFQMKDIFANKFKGINCFSILCCLRMEDVLSKKTNTNVIFTINFKGDIDKNLDMRIEEFIERGVISHYSNEIAKQNDLKCILCFLQRYCMDYEEIKAEVVKKIGER